MMLVEAHGEIRRADADDQADDGAPAAHRYVMRVGRGLAHEGAIEIVGPDGGEGADVAGHPGHESGDQRGDAEAEQAGSHIARHHQREHIVIGMLAGDGGALRDQMIRQHGEAEQAGEDHDQRARPF